MRNNIKQISEKEMLIENVRIINSDSQICGNIHINNGKIEAIDEVSEKNCSRIIALPGGIDPHVHFALPTAVGNSTDDFETGSLAAIAGGTTTIIDFVTPAKNESFIEALEKRKKEAALSKTNFALHVSPTWWGENSAKEIEQCVKNHNVNSFKVYLAYKNSVGIDDKILAEVFETVKNSGGIVTLHCENGDLIDLLRRKAIEKNNTSPLFHYLTRPAAAEAEAVNRAIELAKVIGVPIYIVHVSSRQAVKLIEKAQKRGQKVYAETCPQYLVLDNSVYYNNFEQSAKYVISPPIRSKKHQLSLWKAIKRGVIQTIGTDHCPFNLKGQKDVGINNFTLIPNGAGGVEYRLRLLYTYGVAENKITMQKLVEITAENAARIFKLKNKGRVEVGYDADIVLFDENFEETVTLQNQVQKCDSNIYEGFKLKGKIINTIIGGKIF